VVSGHTNNDGPEKQQPQKYAGDGESDPLAVDERVVSARGGKKVATDGASPDVR
jgi:hypothetical protein